MPENRAAEHAGEMRPLCDGLALRLFAEISFSPYYIKGNKNKKGK
jgi:hypothetical protein